ncbi:FAM10 family protein [Camellia lanceoleosa]|uniref:FAM10 family protein n=1 Tax=Camellia lanceoleosa TaxID=1840588 RepID=A0ACC0GD70_9ERIC|nr:FAM10 family protein [Camellia lanceoleosa]
MGAILYLDTILVPLSLFLTIGYHALLWHNFKNKPFLTTFGMLAQRRREWLKDMQQGDDKMGMLAVQSLRNTLMATILTSTVSILLTLSLAALTNSTYTATHLFTNSIFGSQSSKILAVKYGSASVFSSKPYVVEESDEDLEDNEEEPQPHGIAEEKEESEIVESDNDLPQKDAAQDAKAKAMEAISEGKLKEAIEHLTYCVYKMKKPNAVIRDANAALEVEPNAQKIEEHRRKYEKLRKEREERKIERERQRRHAEAQIWKALPCAVLWINLDEDRGGNMDEDSFPGMILGLKFLEYVQIAEEAMTSIESTFSLDVNSKLDW